MRGCTDGWRYRLGTDTGHGARAGTPSGSGDPLGVTHPARPGPEAPAVPADGLNDVTRRAPPLRADQLEGSPRGTHRRRGRPAEVLFLREEPEAGQEAHRRPGGLHL